MEPIHRFSEAQIGKDMVCSVRDDIVPYVNGRLSTAIYSLALAASISVWFLAIRAPLWLDETSSFWQISGGFSRIMSRTGELPPAYPYVLWLLSKVTGTSEVGLRMPSVVAMLAAAYLIFRTAREIFDLDVAMIVACLFCLNPVVAFASIDARPYALGAFAAASAIFLLVRLRRSDSDSLAAFFGVTSAVMVHFHLLFVVLLPFFAICFLIFKIGDRKLLFRQSLIAFAAFFLVLAPLIPDLIQTFKGRQTFVFGRRVPRLIDLGATVSPGWLMYIFALALVAAAAATGRLNLRSLASDLRLWFCILLGPLPILVLYLVTTYTSTNIFVTRYRLIAIPGIALTWGWLLSRIDSHLFRALFCVAAVSAAVYGFYSSPDSKQHGYTWKYALEIAEKNAATDNASVLICSDFPSSDYFPMPDPSAVKDSGFFTPLSYYPLTVPVVGLPRAFNAEARRIGSNFLLQATQRHERFLALGFGPSYDTLRWLANLSSPSYEVRILGQPDGVAVLEFTPVQPATERIR